MAISWASVLGANSGKVWQATDTAVVWGAATSTLVAADLWVVPFFREALSPEYVEYRHLPFLADVVLHAHFWSILAVVSIGAWASSSFADKATQPLRWLAVALTFGGGVLGFLSLIGAFIPHSGCAIK
ncbi:MAG: hypothetical protein HYV07_21625 [Deltaproteobacteria bacterium]|nr:hypothetical protein [Deltaproteobacteria bacterium]